MTTSVCLQQSQPWTHNSEPYFNLRKLACLRTQQFCLASQMKRAVYVKYREAVFFLGFYLLWVFLNSSLYFMHACIHYIPFYVYIVAVIKPFCTKVLKKLYIIILPLIFFGSYTFDQHGDNHQNA